MTRMYADAYRQKAQGMDEEEMRLVLREIPSVLIHEELYRRDLVSEKRIELVKRISELNDDLIMEGES